MPKRPKQYFSQCQPFYYIFNMPGYTPNIFKLIVVPDNLSVEDIVKMNLAMKKELDILKYPSSDTDKIIDQSSTYIHKSIMDMKWKSPWPTHPSDIDIRSFLVP